MLVMVWADLSYVCSAQGSKKHCIPQSMSVGKKPKSYEQVEKLGMKQNLDFQLLVYNTVIVNKLSATGTKHFSLSREH